MTEKTAEPLTDPESGDFAAARVAAMVRGLMETVESRCPDMGKTIADRMGVTPARISQLLGGDGNVRMSTLARFLDACGYKLELTARPKNGEGDPITLPRPTRRRASTSDPVASTSDAGESSQATGDIHAYVGSHQHRDGAIVWGFDTERWNTGGVILIGGIDYVRGEAPVVYVHPDPTAGLTSPFTMDVLSGTWQSEVQFGGSSTPRRRRRSRR